MLAHGGDMLMLSTPAGRRGRFHSVWNSDDDAWQRIQVTAEQCSHIEADFLEEERLSLGDKMYEQEYCCSFLAGIGNIFGDDIIDDMRLSADESPIRQWLPAREEMIVRG